MNTHNADVIDWLYTKQHQHQEENSPVTSNWPFHDEPKKKPAPAPVWFIDAPNGLTVGKAKSVAEAKMLLKHMPGCYIRPYAPTIEEIDQDNREKRELYRQGVIVRRKHKVV